MKTPISAPPSCLSPAAAGMPEVLAHPIEDGTRFLVASQQGSQQGGNLHPCLTGSETLPLLHLNQNHPRAKQQTLTAQSGQHGSRTRRGQLGIPGHQPATSPGSRSPSGAAGGLTRLSRVQGPRDDGSGGKPGTRQANIRICSSAQLVCRAWSHSRNRRIPSHRSCKSVDLGEEAAKQLCKCRNAGK